MSQNVLSVFTKQRRKEVYQGGGKTYIKEVIRNDLGGCKTLLVVIRMGVVEDKDMNNLLFSFCTSIPHST